MLIDLDLAQACWWRLFRPLALAAGCATSRRCHKIDHLFADGEAKLRKGNRRAQGRKLSRSAEVLPVCPLEISVFKIRGAGRAGHRGHPVRPRQLHRSHRQLQTVHAAAPHARKGRPTDTRRSRSANVPTRTCPTTSGCCRLRTKKTSRRSATPFGSSTISSRNTRTRST